MQLGLGRRMYQMFIECVMLCSVVAVECLVLGKEKHRPEMEGVAVLL